MSSGKSVSLQLRLRRGVSRHFFRWLFKLLFRVRVTGMEHVPEGGAYLVVYNHISLIEPPLILSFWPKAIEALGTSDLWERWGQSFLVRLYGTIPVRRGEFNRQLLKNMIEILNSERALMIAPEGGRSHEIGMRRALPGVAYLVDKTSVPIVPVGIVGSTEIALVDAFRGKRPPLEIRVGPQFQLPSIGDLKMPRKDARQYRADQIMEKIAELLPPEYHGVYSKNHVPYPKTNH